MSHHLFCEERTSQGEGTARTRVLSQVGVNGAADGARAARAGGPGVSRRRGHWQGPCRTGPWRGLRLYVEAVRKPGRESGGEALLRRARWSVRRGPVGVLSRRGAGSSQTSRAR